MPLTRRTFLAAAATGLALPPTQLKSTPPAPLDAPGSFPAHEPALAREMVAVSHGNAARVRELLAGRPALAKAAWDWGFGDWETALGAASHVGHPEIARMLIDAGAPATIFSAAMLDDVAAVRAYVAAAPGLQRVKGPHGISLMAHARAGNARRVLEYLTSLGDADPQYRNLDLSEADRAALVGMYRYGPAADERLTVAAGDSGALMIRREPAPERRLFHQGGRVFHPSGAEAVRIVFAGGSVASELTIADGPLVVVASRVQQPGGVNNPTHTGQLEPCGLELSS